MYLKLFMCLHLVAVLTIVAMPIFMSGERRDANRINPTQLNVKSKEIDSNASQPLEKHTNCDTNFNVANIHNHAFHPHVNGRSHTPIETSSSSDNRNNRDNSNRLFESNADLLQFNNQLERNGGGSLHQRITANSFMHHGHIDAKF